MTTAIALEVEESALSIPAQAQVFRIVSNGDYKQADDLLVAWRLIENEIHTAFDPICDAAFKAHKEATSQRKKYLDPIEAGRSILKPKMFAYQTEQERIRQEAQRKAEKEARKQAEELALQAAVDAEVAGHKELAEAIINEPVKAAPVSIPKTVPKAETRFRMQYYAEVVDLRRLVIEIAAGRQPLTLIEPNMPALNKIAVALKDSMNIPGVVAKSKPV